jgi:glycosyltransferase involved in cell wall biosynthesis
MFELDVLCFSHLRWKFVFQRPQHLLVRAARQQRVFYIEEPIETEGGARLETRFEDGVRVVVPHLPRGLSPAEVAATQRGLLDELLRDEEIGRFLVWFYTPMALAFTAHLEPEVVVFDCMDELSAFKDAPPDLLAREQLLLQSADLVFTGGQSLFEAKRDRHHDIHPFPSSVDVPHFAQARTIVGDPPDQASIASPRIGYVGVIDERMDLDLVAGLADLRRDLQIIMIGPVVKIDPATLPRRANLHWLGGKAYADLPGYLAGWDVAIMPFARNESTRFISPTKTPEFLAAGLPVVSTSIRDVVRPYGELGLVRIADSPQDFAAAVDEALHEEPVTDAADAFLADLSWDRTWEGMCAHIERVVAGSARTPHAAAPQSAVAAGSCHV